MTKEEARRIMRTELESFRAKRRSELIQMIDAEAVTAERAGPSGKWYQIEIQAFWDDRPDGNIRVLDGISGKDDGKMTGKDDGKMTGKDDGKMKGIRECRSGRVSAFTLIELLIVVAIIAILAAIAVPNFLEAQVRSKVARVKADIRSLITALEAYVVDNNDYPPEGGNWLIDVTYLNVLSTPVAYITSVNVSDPFAPPGGNRSADDLWYWPDALTYITYFNYWMKGCYGGLPLRKAAGLASRGPDRERDGLEHYLVQMNHPDVVPGQPLDRLYDPTNGTRSGGDIGRNTGEVGAGSIPQ